MEPQGQRREGLDEIERRRKLGLIDQWRASGLSLQDWARGQDISAQQMQGWLTHEGRWRARLLGQKAPAPKPRKPSVKRAFAPVHITAPAPASMPQSVRIEHSRAALVLHWPLGASAQLAQLLRAL